MKNNIKISSLQMGFITFFLSQVAFFPLVSSLMFKSSKQNIWISIIVGFILGLSILKLFLKFQEKLVDTNIIEYNLKKFGKIFGNLINFIITSIVTLITISIFSKFCIFINLNYLPDVSIIILGIVFILIGVYAVKKGVQSIARTSQILGIISIILFICSILLNAYNFDFNNVLPIFENNIGNVFISSIYYALSSTIPIFLLSIFSKNIVLEQEKYNKSLIWGYIISSVVIFIIMVTTLLILGKNLIISFEYPEYIAFKQIQYFHFIERLENIFSAIWIFNVFIFIAISIYFINEYIKKQFNLKKDSYIILGLIGIILILLTNIIIFIK